MRRLTAAGEWAAAVVVAAVVLGPALAPGYLLRYDLVSVPRPALGVDALGLGDRMPRAVPWDALVAVLARVLPDAWLVQPLAWLALAAAGAGAARLGRGTGAGRWVALLVAVWNPFVAEQLGIGHVPHLVAYGALPWVAVLVHRAVRAPRPAAVLSAAACAAVGSVTPGGGALCVTVAVAAALAGLAEVRRPARPPGARRAAAVTVALAAAAQLPWVLAGALHPAHGRTDAASATLFAVRGETPLGPLVDALALGGMWNDEAVPGSRRTVLAVAGAALLLSLAAAGVGPVLRSTSRAVVVAAGGTAAACYLVAVLGALPGGPGLLRALTALPGLGLVRDGHRWLAVPALVLAVLAGAGAGRLAGLTSRGVLADEQVRPAAARRASVLLLTGCAVVAVLPDGGFGLAGALRPVALPASWTTAATRLDEAPDRSRVLVLPWQPFRRFPWSGRAPVLDPLPRMVSRPVLVSDRLRVGTVALAPEGPGAALVEAALSDDRLDAAEARDLAVGWVAVERGTPGTVPALPAGSVVVDAPDLLLVRLPDRPDAPGPGRRRTIGVLAGHAAWLLVLSTGLAGVVPLRRSTLRGRTRSPGIVAEGAP